MRNIVLKALKVLNVGGVNDEISSLTSSKVYLLGELQSTNILKRDLSKEVEEMKIKNKELEEFVSKLTEENEYLKNSCDTYKEDLNKLETYNDSVLSGVSEFVLKRLVKIEDLATEEIVDDLYNFSVNLDNEGWEELSIVREFINEDIYSYFYYEDNLGYFENMDGWQLISWYEKMKFAEIVDSEFIGSYEKCKYSDYDDKTEYIKYREEVKKALIKHMISKNPMKFLDKITEIEEKLKFNNNEKVAN